MTGRKRLSICYAAPGQNLLPSAGPTRNVLNLANALSQWADVTVAFRSICEPICTGQYKVVAIEPRRISMGTAKDDNAIEGFILGNTSYCRRLSSFPGSRRAPMTWCWRRVASFGLLVGRFPAQRRASVLIENDVRFWTEPLTNLEGIAGKYILHSTAHWVAGRSSRRAPVVIAETQELKSILVKQRELSPDRVEVVGLGVDHALFRPGDQQSARKACQICPDTIACFMLEARMNTTIWSRSSMRYCHQASLCRVACGR